MNIDLKNYEILKLSINWSKSGVVSLKTLSGTTAAKAGGYGYDKKAACFKQLFKKLGFDVSKICESKFDLTYYPRDHANNFLKDNKINYKINYFTSINDRIEFIELEKLILT